MHIQVPKANITWKQCANLPNKLSLGKATVIKGKLYCGGGATDSIVYSYDDSQDQWTTLPAVPTMRFGLGEISGSLVAVGGVKSHDQPTNEVYTYDERSKKWKQMIPPMPTARMFPGILSLQSALVVAGGTPASPSVPSLYTDVVELFKPDTSSWYTTYPLPTACYDVTLICIGNKCYALGGYNGLNLNQTHYSSVDELLQKAIPAKPTSYNGTCDAQSIWKTLTNSPTYRPDAAVLASKLVTIGGMESSKGGVTKKEIYAFSSSSNSWIYVSDLPAPRTATAVALLSSAEILVIGGWSNYYASGRVNTVYKGTLHLEI